MTRITTVLMIVLLGSLGTGRGAAKEPSAESMAFFEKQVRPLLVAHCQKCHTAGKTKGGLSLDSREALLKGGDGGPAIVPHKPDESPLIIAVRYQDEPRMPKAGKLKNADVDVLVKWVEMGAPWPDSGGPAPPDRSPVWDWAKLRQDHWAWQPVQAPQVPVVKDGHWSRNPVDQFILAALEAHDMTPAPAADRRTLIRRASLDLIGVPPTPEEVEAFLRDDAADAFARVVDRLLASPHYGERWARHWLDVARYNDGHGNGFDGPDRPEAFRYRDWVVQALNRDLPFDAFVRQQLAGDLMGGLDMAVATGFLALGPVYTSDGGDPDSIAKARAETLDDRIDTVSRGLLGITVSCARCHDHKFDPIPTLDYYAWAGIFHSSREVNAPIQSDEASRRSEEARKQIREVDRRLEELKVKARNEPKGLAEAEKKEQAELKAERQRLQASLPPPPASMHIMADVKAPVDLPVARRGDPRKPGEIAPRQFLRLLSPDNAPRFMQGSGRRELADAVVRPDNPLTARVFVNRIWMHHFGKALVRTPDNFGKLGMKPTHPELLDWLADHFVRSGWSIKTLHRTILLSSTYQMSSDFHRAHFEKDGDNNYLWRMNPRRLEAEPMRDAMLAVTGELQTNLGGPSDRKFLQSKRRTLYQVVSRNGDRFESDAFLRLWDFPTARATCSERSVSTTPQQYLFLLNSPFMTQRGKALAQRLAREAEEPARRIERAYHLLYGRPPTAKEVADDTAYLAGADWPQYAQMLLASSEFLYLR